MLVLTGHMIQHRTASHAQWSDNRLDNHQSHDEIPPRQSHEGSDQASNSTVVYSSHNPRINT